jgi:hypothetical protein
MNGLSLGLGRTVDQPHTDEFAVGLVNHLRVDLMATLHEESPDLVLVIEQLSTLL